MSNLFLEYVLLLLVPYPFTALATIDLHKQRFLHFRNNSTVEIFSKWHRFCSRVGRCLPRSILPSIFPVVIRCAIPSFLMMWPQNFNSLFLIVCISFFVKPDLVNTSSLEVWLVQLIFIIRRRNHIFVAFNLFSISWEIVQHSQP